MPYGESILSLYLDSLHLFPFLSILEEASQVSVAPQSSLPLPNLTNLTIDLESEVSNRALQRLIPALNARRKFGFEQLEVHLQFFPKSPWQQSAEDVPLPFDPSPLRALAMTGIRVKLTHIGLKSLWTLIRDPKDSCGVWHVLRGEMDGDHQIECYSTGGPTVSDAGQR